jgi:hypothetical protein
MVAPRRIVCVLAALTFASACGTTPTDTKLPLINTPATTSSTTSTWTYTPPTSSTTTSTTSTTTTEPPQVTVPPAPQPPKVTVQTAPKTTAKAPAPPKTTTQAPAAAYYKNCDAARAAGAAPLHRGEPGYRAGLDRDNDGVACE